MLLALCCHPQVCHFPWAQLTLLGTSTCAMGPSVQDHLASQHPHSSGALFTQGALWSSEQLLSPIVLTGYMPLEGHWSMTACTLADYVTKLLVKTDSRLHSECSLLMTQAQGSSQPCLLTSVFRQHRLSSSTSLHPACEPPLGSPTPTIVLDVLRQVWTLCNVMIFIFTPFSSAPFPS